MTEPTPKPWPDGAQPTAEQLADWWVVASRNERIAHAERALRNAEMASRCFVMAHDTLVEQLDHLLQASFQAAKDDQ